jgi:hypothetical protein
MAIITYNEQEAFLQDCKKILETANASKRNALKKELSEILKSDTRSESRNSKLTAKIKTLISGYPEHGQGLFWKPIVIFGFKLTNGSKLYQRISAMNQLLSNKEKYTGTLGIEDLHKVEKASSSSSQLCSDEQFEKDMFNAPHNALESLYQQIKAKSPDIKSTLERLSAFRKKLSPELYHSLLVEIQHRAPNEFYDYHFETLSDNYVDATYDFIKRSMLVDHILDKEVLNTSSAPSLAYNTRDVLMSLFIGHNPFERYLSAAERKKFNQIGVLSSKDLDNESLEPSDVCKAFLKKLDDLQQQYRLVSDKLSELPTIKETRQKIESLEKAHGRDAFLDKDLEVKHLQDKYDRLTKLLDDIPKQREKLKEKLDTLERDVLLLGVEKKFLTSKGASYSVNFEKKSKGYSHNGRWYTPYDNNIHILEDMLDFFPVSRKTSGIFNLFAFRASLELSTQQYNTQINKPELDGRFDSELQYSEDDQWAKTAIFSTQLLIHSKILRHNKSESDIRSILTQSTARSSTTYSANYSRMSELLSAFNFNSGISSAFNRDEHAAKEIALRYPGRATQMLKETQVHRRSSPPITFWLLSRLKRLWQQIAVWDKQEGLLLSQELSYELSRPTHEKADFNIENLFDNLKTLSLKQIISDLQNSVELVEQAHEEYKALISKSVKQENGMAIAKNMFAQLMDKEKQASFEALKRLFFITKNNFGPTPEEFIRLQSLLNRTESFSHSNFYTELHNDLNSLKFSLSAPMLLEYYQHYRQLEASEENNNAALSYLNLFFNNYEDKYSPHFKQAVNALNDWLKEEDLDWTVKDNLTRLKHKADKITLETNSQPIASQSSSTLTSLFGIFSHKPKRTAREEEVELTMVKSSTP